MYNSTIKKSQKIDICLRTFEFSQRIVNLVTKLPNNIAAITIGKQLIRSGTSVGANVEESQNAGTKKEFIYGITIALKEARETYYWIRLLVECKIMEKSRLELLINENVEIIRILTTIIKHAKK